MEDAKNAGYPSLNVLIIAQLAMFVSKKWTIIVYGLTGALGTGTTKPFYSSLGTCQ